MCGSTYIGGLDLAASCSPTQPLMLTLFPSRYNPRTLYVMRGYNTRRQCRQRAVAPRLYENPYCKVHPRDFSLPLKSYISYEKTKQKVRAFVCIDTSAQNNCCAYFSTSVCEQNLSSSRTDCVGTRSKPGEHSDLTVCCTITLVQGINSSKKHESLCCEPEVDRYRCAPPDFPWML